MAWTPEQEKAIKTRDRTLLVSAAAGSGKTATLTERIIRSLLDEENPMDIDRMLIATYTNAAVDELRERIGKAIKAASLERPDDKRLEEQLLKLKDAKILTITSFCNSILRASAESIGIAPNYRIAEPAEAKILSSRTLEALINAAYEGELTDVCTPEEFITVADCISNVKHSEGLSGAIAFIFEKLTYSERGIDTLSTLIEEYNPDKFESVESTFFGSYIVGEVKYALKSYGEAYKKAIRLAGTEKLDLRSVPKAEGDLAFIEKVISKTTYDEIRDLLASPKFESLSRSAKEEPTEFYTTLRFLRTGLTTDIKALYSDLLFYSTEEWRDLYTKLYNLLTILYKFLKKYYTVFMEEKRSRGVCEFSDVERYAYDALYKKDGTITDLARELSEKFDAIYVDEYQDVNALQGRIFEAISKENNRFMVGDIKQSIYGFRSARPEIFLDMKNRFPILNTEGDYPAASIFMSNNFRCDKMVVDFVNGVFDTMFGLLGESIGYVDNDKLVFSKIYTNGDTPRGVVPEIHLIELPGKATAEDENDPGEAIIKEDRDKKKLEAECIANKISELLENGTLASGKRPRPRDIAILMRSVKGDLAEEITNALKRHGIASSINETGDLLMCEEVLLALSFLYSIDNPRKDIYLCALMLSPLFSFTPDEVVSIRRGSKRETRWEALIDYVRENPAFERGKSFIASILKYRKLAEGERSDSLISLIYRESGLMALASKNGSRDNLVLLHSYARKYESSEFKGLYSFVSYISEVTARGETFPAAGSADDSDAVRLMTVHRSKGLEFPVTILAGTSSVGKSDAGAKIAFHESFGIAIKTRDDSGLAVIDNPVVNAITRYSKAVSFDEDLRVLYVALTRAREQLYVFGCSPKKTADEYIEYINTMRDVLNPYFAAKARTNLDKIMISRTCGNLIVSTGAKDSTETAAEEMTATLNTEEPKPSLTAEDYVERFSFKYPKSHLERLPKKISVSRLSPAMLDADESAVGIDELSVVESFLNPKTEEIIATEDDTDSPPTLPDFITGRVEGESAKRGIATHKIMQFCDFESLEKDTKGEVDRLIREEFISKEDGERVRIKELSTFVRSPLFREIKSAKAIHRELRFNVFLGADAFTEEDDKKALLKGERILVQGVIDCLIENEKGEYHLIDYKTDRLSREELLDEALGEEKLRKAHTLQLSYYKEAVKQIFGKAPTHVGIYSLHLGKEVILDV